jgi:hypothetical protein
MRLLIFSVALFIVGSWLALGSFLLGHTLIEGFVLKLPESTAELGDSAGILNGLFSSLAVVLALVAVLLQGKDLKESTAAQNAQAQSLAEQLENQKRVTKAIVEQLEQQQISNRIMLFQAQQQYHVSEMERMDSTLKNIKDTKRSDNLFQNCVDKKKRHKAELEKIQSCMEALGNET